MWKFVTVNSSGTVDFDDYVNVDSNVEIASYPTDEDMVGSILGAKTNQENDCSDEDDNDDPKLPPTLQEVDTSMENLRRYFESREHVPENIFNSLSVIETFVAKEKFNRNVQTKITDFFMQK